MQLQIYVYPFLILKPKYLIPTGLLLKIITTRNRISIHVEYVFIHQLTFEEINSLKLSNS